MAQKKRKVFPRPEPTTPGSLEVRYLADGAKVMPVVNGKPMYPECMAKSQGFADVLEVLACSPSLKGSRPEEDTDDSTDLDLVVNLLDQARHWADLQGIDFATVDREAHAAYAALRWSCHEAEGKDIR